MRHFLMPLSEQVARNSVFFSAFVTGTYKVVLYASVPGQHSITPDLDIKLK